MPKNTLIIAVIAVVAVLGLGGFLFLNQNKAPSESMMETGESVMESIFASKASMECNYEDEETGTTVVAYIKNGMVRSDFDNPNDPQLSGSVIVKDETIYFWNPEGAFMMRQPEIDDDDGEETSMDKTDAERIVGNIEEYREYCREANVADSHFDLPQNVEFQDFSEFMGGMMEETGTPSDNLPNQEQMEQLLEQYGAEQ